MSTEPVLTAKEAKAWDEYSIRQAGVDSKLLMGWAAQSVARAMQDLQLLGPGKKILVLTGSGNNGGDGLALAWLLFTEYNQSVELCCVQKPKTPDALYFFELVKKVSKKKSSQIQFIRLPLLAESKADVIVDAMLGIGFHGKLKPALQKAINFSNNSGSVRLAVDIASGVYANGDAFEHESFKAHYTLAIGSHKVGSLTEPGCFFSGKNQVVPIGFAPYDLPDRRTAQVQKLRSLRKPDGHKYTSGSVVFYGGSRGMEGAMILSVRAFLQLGGGMTKLCSDSRAFKKQILEVLPESQVFEEEDAATSFVKVFCDSKTQLGVLGMGLDHDPGPAFWKKVLAAKGKVLVVDGGGLRFLSKHLGLLSKHQLKALVLTPHKGEWQDLLKKQSNNIFEDLSAFAEQNSCFMIAKGYGLFIMSRHNTARFFLQQEFSLATAGTGDILNGVLANYLLREADILAALEQACFAYLQAAKTARGTNMETLVPSDLIQKLKDNHNAIL